MILRTVSQVAAQFPDNKGELLQQVTSLRADIVRLQQEHKAEIRSLRAESEILQLANRSLRSDTDRLQQENRSLRADTDRLQQENRSLRSDTCRLQQENTSLRAESERLQQCEAEIRSLRAQLQEAQLPNPRKSHHAQVNHKVTITSLLVSHRCPLV